jgi:rsbT co-antagonist protein RsbR
LPAYEIGRQAVDLVLAQVAGEEVPEQTLVPPKMVVRRSCGCQFLAVTQAATEPVIPASKEVELGAVLEAQHAQILLDMVEAIEQNDAEGVVTGWVEQVLDSFAAEMEGGAPGMFLATLEDVLSRVMAAGGAPTTDPRQRVAAWQGAVSALRRWMLPYLERDTGTQSEGLWQQARVMIAVMLEQAQARQALQVEQQAAALRGVSQTLITTFDVSALVDALADGLLQLGIPGAYLVLYENPAKPVEWSRLMLAYGEEGRVDLGADGLRFPSPQLVPEGMWPQGRRYSFMVSPLFFQENELGFILYEMGSQGGTIYDTLRTQISSALQGALLVQRVREHSAELARQQYVLDTFMENIPDRVYFKDLESRITRANKSHATGLGLNDPSEEIGKSDFDFFPEEQARPKYEQEQEIIRTGDPILDLEEPDGVGHWALTTKMPLRDENGEIIGTFGISRDITAMKEAQVLLERAYAEVEQQVAERTAELEREQEERARAQAESLRLQQEVIEAQQRAIRELSTPIIPVLEGVIVMPLIGSIDTLRAKDVTRSLLAGIREHSAKVVILDITGVPTVDSGVAAYLNKTIQAARLKGARTIVTGISEAVAEMIVDLGIDWGNIETMTDLQTGLQTVLTGIK